MGIETDFRSELPPFDTVNTLRLQTPESILERVADLPIEIANPATIGSLPLRAALQHVA